jgi:DNA-binding NarL/FixJ family response regulator
VPAFQAGRAAFGRVGTGKNGVQLVPKPAAPADDNYAARPGPGMTERDAGLRGCFRSGEMKCPEELAKAAGLWNVLVVDADASLGELVRQGAKAVGVGLAGAGGGGVGTHRVRAAPTAGAALLEMQRSPADVVLVNLQVDDNGGLDLIRTCKRRWPRAQVVAVSRVRRSEVCLDAWRAGAADMLLAPVGLADVQRALGAVAAKGRDQEKLAQRNERLRTVCRRLNKARHEIKQQVDLLCNDLVRAYQDMAQQLNFTQLAADYAQFVRGEIEVEGLLRRTMEWVLRKLGPVNAAVYLPNGQDYFALGAYLNLDTQADAALIDALGKTVVQQAREGTGLLSLDTDRAIDELFGDDAALLRGRAWLAAGCQTARECLAVLVVFKRQAGQGEAPASDAETRGLIEAIAPLFADRIEQALGLYHRLRPFQDDDGDGDIGRG